MSEQCGAHRAENHALRKVRRPFDGVQVPGLGGLITHDLADVENELLKAAMDATGPTLARLTPTQHFKGGLTALIKEAPSHWSKR
jgi:hypothetical protein